MSCHLSWAVFVTTLLAVGCGRGSGDAKAPFETFPVNGKIVFKDKKGRLERLERGKVWFQSKADPNLQIVGSIDDDGSFSMSTLQDDKGWAGVPAGKYKVRLEMPPDDEGNPRTDLVHSKYLNFDKTPITVSVPVPDDLTIAVEGPR